MFQHNEEHLRAKHHERGKCRARLPLKHHWLQMHGHLALVSKAKMIWHVECDASNVGVQQYFLKLADRSRFCQGQSRQACELHYPAVAQ